MTAAPEAITTDVANFTACSVIAVLHGYAFTDHDVRHDVWLDTRQMAAASRDRPTNLPQLARATYRAQEALSAARGGQR